VLFFCFPVFSVHQPKFHLPKLQFYFWLSAVCAAFYGCNCGSAVSSRALCIARATDLLWDYDFVYHLMGSFRLPPSAEPQTWTKSSPPDDTGVCFKLMLTQVNYMALLMECGFGFYPTLSLSIYISSCVSSRLLLTSQLIIKRKLLQEIGRRYTIMMDGARLSPGPPPSVIHFILHVSETALCSMSHLTLCLRRTSIKATLFACHMLIWIFSWFPLLGCILLEGCINDQGEVSSNR